MKSLKICLIFIAKTDEYGRSLSYENQAYFGVASFFAVRPKIEKIIKKNKKMSSPHNLMMKITII